MRAVRSPQLMQMTTPSKPNQVVVVQAKVPPQTADALDRWIEIRQQLPSTYGTITRSSVVAKLIENLIMEDSSQ